MPLKTARKAFYLLRHDPLSREIMFFCIVGGIGFLVDFISFITALKFMGDVAARCTALGIATVITWQLNRKFTFLSDDPLWGRELVRFTATRLVGAAVNAGVSLSVLWEFPHYGKLFALVCGTACAMVFNYFSAKFWAYR